MGVSRQAHQGLPTHQRFTQNAPSTRPGRGDSPLRHQPGVSRKPVRLPVPEGPRLRKGASLRRRFRGLGKRGIPAGGRKRRVAEGGDLEKDRLTRRTSENMHRANFLEFLLPSTRVNKGKTKGRGCYYAPAP